MALGSTDGHGRSGVAPAPWARGIATSEPVSRRGQIVAALREAIVTGEIPAGAQLKQDEIGALFHASPGPVREALRELVSEGLVEHHPNRGSFVSELSTDELLKVVLPVRLLAESYAIGKITQEMPAGLEARLEHQIAVMDRGAGTNDLAEVIEADIRFHRIVMEAAGSYHVMQLWQSVLSRIRVQLYRLGPRHRTLGEVPEEHRQLLAAIRTADPAVIDAVLHEHIIEASSNLLATDAPPGGPE